MYNSYLNLGGCTFMHVQQQLQLLLHVELHDAVVSVKIVQLKLVLFLGLLLQLLLLQLLLPVVQKARVVHQVQ
jgi:hypothetical protein